MDANIKLVRHLLGFLFDYMSKYEEKEKGADQPDLNNVLAVRVQRELQKWRVEQWVLPEFLDRKRDVYITHLHLRNGQFFAKQLVERYCLGSNNILSNSMEYIKMTKEQELANGRISMEMREENQEQKIRVDKMKRAFGEAYVESAQRQRPLSMWERKKQAKELLDKRMLEDGSSFGQKVILRKKKRYKEKNKDLKEVKKEQEAGQTEEKKEAAPVERQETPQEAFQRKLDNLKLVINE